MPVADVLRLLLLSVIWGASFLLMRIAAPEFGPVSLILMRAVIATICFAGVFRIESHRRIMRKHLGGFLLLGIVNTALPFTLLAYATLSLETGFTSLLNATTPLFAAVIGAAIYSTPLRKIQVIGLLIALGGVSILSSDSLDFKPGGTGIAVIAAILASASYGVAVNFTKHRLADVPPQAVSAGSLASASLLLLIPGIWLWPETMPSNNAWICTLLLGIVCTGVAYALFFRLLKRTGAMAASSVTFLIPVSAILWGATILGEKIYLQLLVGMLVTLGGTALAIGLLPRKSYSFSTNKRQ